ncbi:hypothetical protein H2200_011807 [Cladophialophora chaetospira]|uniref:Uncharacterized protein n=1 Tax=Cladophialophora chaetospira TaxID=386627 RepID=A0AA39CCW1_9EURO|nr:hypothetical protein H2200_011807 [Cladophialophora chaetospira]
MAGSSPSLSLLGRLPPRGKARLLEYMHFAHVLCIEPLMKAMMHTLLIIMHRSPGSFTGPGANKLSLDHHMWANNPAGRVLRRPDDPEWIGEQAGTISCDKDYRKKLFTMNVKELHKLSNNNKLVSRDPISEGDAAVDQAGA